MKVKVIDLRVGQWINLYGRRRVIDVHNLPRDMLLLVTNRGEFEMAAAATVTACQC